MASEENRSVNEVILNGESILSTRKDTVAEDNLVRNESATDKAGKKIKGELDVASNEDTYNINDPIDDIADEDYIPFNDVSDPELPKKKTLFSNLVEKLTKFFLPASSIGGKSQLTFNDNGVLDLQLNNIDASKEDNNVTVNNYPSTANIKDKAKRIIMCTEAVVSPEGTIGWKAYTRNYDTAGEVVEQKGMQFHMDKSGNLSYQIDDKNAFRKAIKTVDQVGAEIPVNADLNTYTTAGTYYIRSNQGAQTIANCPDSFSGKLIVLYHDNNNGYRLKQIYLPNGDRQPFIRHMDYGGNFTVWRSFPFTNQVHLLTEVDKSHWITGTADLNDYTESGTYQCERTSVTSLANCPVTTSFKLIVDRAYKDSSSEIMQTITLVNNQNYPQVWFRIRQYGSSTWSDWVQPTKNVPKTYTVNNESVNGMEWDGLASNGTRAIVKFNQDNQHLRHNFYNGTAWTGEHQLANIEDVAPSQIGDGYAVATVSGSAITATITGFKLRTGVIVSLQMPSEVYVDSTLNINSTGAKYIRSYNYTPITYGSPLLSDNIYTFMYDGTYYRIISQTRTPSVSTQNYIADTSGNILINWGFGVNRAQIKYIIQQNKLRWNYHKDSTWRGDVVIADYDDIVHQTLGVAIPDNADLNNYTANGVYNITSNVSAQTINNRPCDYAGKLIVQRITANNYIKQIFITYDSLIYMGVYERTYNGDSGGGWREWRKFAEAYDGKLELYQETSTADDKYTGITARIKDTTTNQTFAGDVLRVYQDHQASTYGANILLGGGGATIIGSGEAASNHYDVLSKPLTSEDLYLTADGSIHLQAKGNTIAERKGFRITTNQEILPCVADVLTNGVGSIGNSTYKLANIYTDKINGSTPAVASDVITTNRTVVSVTSLDDIPLNTAGVVTLDASLSPTGVALSYVYLCYGNSNMKTLELIRANHADKTTEERWYNANNGSGWTGWMPLSRQGTYVGTCATAADQRAKEATVDADFSLKKGVRVAIKFSNSNTYSSSTSNPVTLNVNGTGAKNIYYFNTHSGAGNTGTNTTVYGYANRYIYYIYDGTYWVWDSHGYDNNNDIRPSAYCDTAAGTAAKEASCSGYKLLTNSHIHILFVNGNTSASALTLNINGQGAKPIILNGAPSSSSNYNLPAGTYIVYYDGTNYFFRTDGNINIRDNIKFRRNNTELFFNSNYVSGESGNYGLNIVPYTDKNDRAQLKISGVHHDALFYNYCVNGAWKGDGLVFNKWFPNIVYCTSSTEAGTAAKVASTQGGGRLTTLVVGMVACVVHSNNNTASNCTLNIDDTGAKQIYYNQGTYTGSNDWICGRQNLGIFYIYDGTYWRWLGMGKNDNSTGYLPNNDTGVVTTIANKALIYLKSTDIDLTQADNGVTVTRYPAFRTQDKDGRIMSGFETCVQPNGNIETYLQVRNYNTSDSSNPNGGIKVIMDKAANVTYWLTNPHKFNAATGFGYGTCTTAADQRVKVVNIPNFVLTVGGIIGVKFSNTNTYSATTDNKVCLNVNGTGEKPIYYGTGYPTGTHTTAFGYANKVHYYMYDGTNWVWLNHSQDNDGNNRKSFYGTCATAADQQIKVVTLADTNGWELRAGTIVGVRFSNANTFSSQTATPVQLNVNNTGAKNIWYGNTHSGAGNTGTNTRIYGEANRVFTYMYDGTYWVWLNCGYEADTVDPRSLSFGYGTCDTAEATTAKVVSLGSYNLRNGGYVSVKFTNAVPANATMNINSKGAKNIWYRGANITANKILAGDIATFVYDGTRYQLVGIDRSVSGGSSGFEKNVREETSTGLPPSNCITDTVAFCMVIETSYVIKNDVVSIGLALKFRANQTISSNTELFRMLDVPAQIIYWQSNYANNMNLYGYVDTDGKCYVRPMTITAGTYYVQMTYLK